MQKLDLVATVKSSTIVEDVTSCEVFLFGTIDMTDRKILQLRDQEICGEWEVTEHQKTTLKLRRVSGDQDLQEVDALYAEHVEPVIVAEVAAVQRVLVFGGKNWKLASEKKWVETLVDVTHAPIIGEVTVRGQLHDVRKLGDGFAATPKTA